MDRVLAGCEAELHRHRTGGHVIHGDQRYTWRQTYSDTKPGPLERGERTDRTGTSVTFWSDPTIFESTEYNYETIYRRLADGRDSELEGLLPDLVYAALLPYLGTEAAANARAGVRDLGRASAA